MTTMRAVTMILRRPDRKILMHLRDSGQGVSIPFPNMWNFPGGVVEDGETPLATGIREMAEEFEIVLDPSACCELYVFSHDHALNDYVFLCAVRLMSPPFSMKAPLLHG
jgi:8-oxo-dGTP diphosphatase